ncbi:hypothetical protein NKG94_08980 [Micromonospora sp. M12]
MNDSDVRGILHRATDDLVSPPGLLAEVRRVDGVGWYAAGPCWRRSARQWWPCPWRASRTCPAAPATSRSPHRC